jgi:chemotaxis signal transduction protein
LIVDSASDVLKIPAKDIDPSPTEFVEGGLNCVTGLGKYQGRLIVLLDIEKVLEFSGSRPAGDAAKNAGQPATGVKARVAAASK